jgi:AraC-like DNA-binding protein
MAADPLSDVLKTVRLTGAVFFEIAGKAPWVAESPPRERLLPKILPGAEHLIAYHVVTEGRCFGALVGGEPVTVDAGEVIVFTNCDPHVMSSGPGMRAETVDLGVCEAATADQLPLFLTFNGHAAGPATNLVCGYLACDSQPFNPLLQSLPPVIKVGDGDTGWLRQFIRFATMEAGEKRAGGESVLAKLSELMFVEVVRRYLESMPPDRAGWLAGLRDPWVGKALSAMHRKPADDWTIEALARQVGVSRSVLYERFTELVGVPPMQYLAKWRMQIASGLLSGGRANVATVAAEIGYASEAAFSRAFKKMVGVPPSAWRRRSGGDGYAAGAPA